jgi:diadenosine tetraphosphatase ApaH/serine/threonine PP2A family protein phosphatase
MSNPVVPPIDLASLGHLDRQRLGDERTGRRAWEVAAAGAAAIGLTGLGVALRAQLRPRRRSYRQGWVAAGIGAATLGVARWQLARFFTPTPPYEVEERRGPLEVRRYERLWLAQTTVSSPSWDEALRDGFRRLAHFIFGANDEQTRIAMTSPVTATRDGADTEVSFVMPEGVVPPSPDDARIRFTEVPARRVAVLRFHGRYDEDTVEAKKRELVAAAEEAGYVAHGEPAFAGYDPPTTLPALRRNEVWLEVEG